MIGLFTGYDAREAGGSHTFDQSVIEFASELVAFIPLSASKHRDGSNAFTYSRFEIPSICEFSGFAIFADGADMLCLADIAELWSLRDEKYAVQVVKHEYETRHPRKYVGTAMECDNRDYPRKNWSSLAIWNCGHPANRILTRLNVSEWSGQQLHGFSWLPDDLIGGLPSAWNCLVDEYDIDDMPKIAHFTAGIPAIKAYENTPCAEQWRLARLRAQQTP